MSLQPVFIALVPLAWLVPNHFLPWLSSWSDGLAMAGLAMAMLAARASGRLSMKWVAFCALALITVAVQSAANVIHFGGDAATAALYVCAFACAIILGSQLCEKQRPDSRSALHLFAFAVLSAAILSVGVACVQWTGAVDGGGWAVSMARGGRPYGNVAQPNHLSTICFLGLVGAGLLHQDRRIGRLGFWLAALWLIFGIVMSGSRTGWVQIILLATFMIAQHRPSRLELGPNSLVGVLAITSVFVWCWPHLNEWLLLSEGRSAAEAARAGTRPLHWAAMLEAIQREPLWGYGWQQVSLAQLSVADGQPWVGEFIEHSHNVALDLLVWNGLPLGLLLIGLAAWWFVSRMARCRDAHAAWMLAGALGLLAHGLLEYPLEYAYFLIPFGLFIGATDALIAKDRYLAVSPATTRFLGVVFTAALVLISIEVIRAEQSYRLLRLESARIGVPGIKTPPPDLKILTQLSALQRFISTEARPGMSTEELGAMRKVSERYAKPPVLFRYALAQGLNGQPDGAALTLLRLCRIHQRERCDEGREAWAILQQRHPSLQRVLYPSASLVHGLK